MNLFLSLLSTITVLVLAQSPASAESNTRIYKCGPLRYDGKKAMPDGGSYSVSITSSHVYLLHNFEGAPSSRKQLSLDRKIDDFWIYKSGNLEVIVNVNMVGATVVGLQSLSNRRWGANCWPSSAFQK